MSDTPRGLKLACCGNHPERTDLSCYKIRRLDGTALTVAEVWAELTAAHAEIADLRAAFERQRDNFLNMKKLEEFEKWMKAGEPLGAQHDRVTAWAAWSTAWDAAISDAADVFWNHDATRKRISIQDSQTVVNAIKSLSA